MDALFAPAGDGLWQPADLTRGPWDPGAQHGGAPAALLAALIERAEPGSALRVARLTVELVRPVPLAELRVEVEVVRPGRRVQLVAARLYAGDELVVRALALRLHRAPGTSPAIGDDGDGPPRGPEHATPTRLDTAGPGLRAFAGDGVEIRFLEGSYAPGPAVAWLRLRVPVIAGAGVTGLQRAAAAADFGNGVSSAVDWQTHTFVNPDLTLHLERDPEGEWIALDARTRVQPDGTGQAESVVLDTHGRAGRAVQSLLVLPRDGV